MLQPSWTMGRAGRRDTGDSKYETALNATEPDNISQTVERSEGHHSEDSEGSLIVAGAGDSALTLGRPRLIAIGRTVEIGRRPVAAPDRDGLVLSDHTVSSRHALILCRVGVADSFTIEDLGSLNGTYVDGARIDGRTKLRNGALVFLGSQVLVFRLLTATQRNAIASDEAHPFAPVATRSPEMARVVAKLRQLAPSDAEILLIGETGVGKEVFARAIHAASGRAGRFIAVNCAALPATLVESELFGYEKGAHSTARTHKAGLVALATGGTLFLDEIGDMPVDLQAKLLRFAQNRRFTPLGATREIESDARIIAATSRTVVGPGAQIHEALLARLGAQPIVLPPLRDRIEDVGPLVGHFIEQPSRTSAEPAGEMEKAEETEKTEKANMPLFQPEAFQALFLHRWPLNVRELAKVIGEAAVLSRGRAIDIDDLPTSLTDRIGIAGPGRGGVEKLAGANPGDATSPSRGASADLRLSRDDQDQPAGHPDTAPGISPTLEKQRIIAALANCAGNQSRAARLLGVSRRALMMRLDRYGIPRPQKGSK